MFNRSLLVSFQKQGPPEGLRGLCQPQVVTVQRPLDLPVRAGLLGCVLHRHRYNGASSFARRLDRPLDEVFRDKGPHRVVDDHDLHVGVGFLQAVVDGLLAGLPAGHDLLHLLDAVPLDDVDQDAPLLLGRHDQDDRIHAGGLVERPERVKQQRDAPQREKLLGSFRAHPRARTAGRDDGDHSALRCARACIQLRATGVSWPSVSSFSRAKIIRPACVCKTLVTTTFTFEPMNRFALSTTIMVPSSR